MASLTKKYAQQKLLGSIYTPQFIVEKILDNIGFDCPDALGKSLLDPACGDGQFLLVAAKRIIELSNDLESLEANLSQLYGWDIDEQAIQACRANLDQLIAGLPISINWHIKQQNALQTIGIEKQKFYYIVGNPPYIRVQHLDLEARKFIQQHYHFCQSGSTDSYIAFYELCYFLLAQQGICALITPNTFLYNETAKTLRQFFATEQVLLQISNYGDIQLFPNATTYSAITLFNKQKNSSFVYEQALNTRQFSTQNIAFNTLQERRIWQLSNNYLPENQGTALSDICQIHVGITTLCDKAYIFKHNDLSNINDQYVWVETPLRGRVKLEKDLLKPIIKASKIKHSHENILKYILFPYQQQTDKYQIIDEQSLQTKYPYSYQYLLSVKDELDKRDNGKPNAIAWYAFGRSQGLNSSFGKKILFSPMNRQPNFILSHYVEATFYSGYCIKYEGDYEWLLEQLNSPQMAAFIAASSRDFRNGWKAYNKRILEHFKVQINN